MVSTASQRNVKALKLIQASYIIITLENYYVGGFLFVMYENYYRELDPKKRLEILNALPENSEIEYLHRLYHERYSDHDNKGRKNVDWWLWRCVCLQQLYGRGGFFRKFRNREVVAIIDELQLNDTDESHRKILYSEYRNLAGRYLSTCRHANYASSFMGFKRADDDEKALRACKDIWEMTRGVAKSENVEEIMRPLCRAFYDELITFDPICREEYERLDAKF